MAIVTRETGESENFTCFFSASCKYVLLVYITYEILIGGGGTILTMPEWKSCHKVGHMECDAPVNVYMAHYPLTGRV